MPSSCTSCPFAYRHRRRHTVAHHCYVLWMARTAVQHGVWLQVLLPMLTHLLKDDQESVRKLALDSMPAFAKTLASTEVQADVLDAASSVIGDRSWRVRHAAAAKMPALAEAFGPSVTETSLVKSFVSLLQVRPMELGSVPPRRT